MLSGFVIAYSYDAKFSAGMTFKQFGIARFVRLYPMILFGGVIGAVVCLLSAEQMHENLISAALFGVCGVLLIPVGLGFGRSAFPSNGPFWSLFFEVLANVGFAVSTRFKIGALTSSIALATSFLLLAIFVYYVGTVKDLGVKTPFLFLGGFSRVSFPFMVGVFISRAGLFSRKLTSLDLLIAAFLVSVLFNPFVGRSSIYDLVIIAMAFPIIIAFGTNSPSSKISHTLWTNLGRISYPFYAVHQPIIRMLSLVFQKLKGGLLSTELAAVIATLVAVAISWAVTVLFDEPVRRWLRTKLASNGYVRDPPTAQ